MDVNKEICRLSDEYTDDLIRIRRIIHENPELGFEEVETAKLVSHTLAGLGIPHQTGIGRTGVVGLIDSGSPGKTVAIRADMDCLPLEENTGLAYA
jgi:metal-dependent amidase/aminoacylase/carboxypeptidase family protein